MICLCTVCRRDVVDSDAKADHFVYDIDGDLKYIELAHLKCAIADNTARNIEYWKTDQLIDQRYNKDVDVWLNTKIG